MTDLAESASRTSLGLSCWQGVTAAMTRAHQHDDIELNFAPGRLTYLVDGRTVDIPASHVAIFWAAKPHQLLDVPSDAPMSWITVPLAQFLAWELPAEFTGELISGGFVTVPASALPLSLESGFVDWASELSSGSSFAAHTAALEIEALVRRIAVSSVSEGLAASSPSTAVSRTSLHSAAAAMAQFIADRSSTQLTVEDVAGHVHLHPQYAMTLFRRKIGITIGEYILQSRIARAQRLLIATDLSVPDVGFTAGFQSLSQFHDRFRAVSGLTPARYRRKHRDS